jgi:RNA polymerase sigma-70 factor (ECF subfamily)
LSQSSRLEQQPLPAATGLAVGEIYAEYAPFVWRNLRRLGVPESAVEDAVQDVFLVIHRRLHEFEARSSLRTWIFGIVMRVAARQREQLKSRQMRYTPATDGLLETLSTATTQGPYDLLVQRQAADLIYWVLDELDEEKRTIVVMVELEQMPVVEVAKVLNINLNTAYTRLRLARRALQAKLQQVVGESGETR